MRRLADRGMAGFARLLIPIFFRDVELECGDATCHEILAGGGLVALFPEGISHDKSSLQPLKTGAARIALGAGIEGGVEGVVTIAVGLTYDAKARFRSRALVRIGVPAEISRWTDAYRRDAHQAVREFTVDIADRLAAVSPGYASWDQAEQLARIAEIVVRQPLPRALTALEFLPHLFQPRPPLRWSASLPPCLLVWRVHALEPSLVSSLRAISSG